MRRQDATTGQIVDDGTGDADINKPNDKQIYVKVYSPFKTYFDEVAQSISAVNATGPFDILPKHHNFLTLLSPCDLIIQTLQGAERRIRIARGVMHVKSGAVTVFLDV